MIGQKQSSSAFGLSMGMEWDAVEFTGPERRLYHTRGDSRGVKPCSRWGACGTRLDRAGGGVRGEGGLTISLQAGMLDEPSGIAPPVIAGPRGSSLGLRRGWWVKSAWKPSPTRKRTGGRRGRVPAETPAVFPSDGTLSEPTWPRLVGPEWMGYNFLMTEAIAFDTHRFVKRLTGSGFTELQAETLAEEQVALLNTNLATKVDIEALRQKTKVDVAEIRADIEALKQATKADIEVLRQETKADIEALKQATKADIEALRQETKADVAQIRADIEALKQATKADIEALRQETKADVAQIRADIEALKQATKADIEALRQETKADMAKIKADIETLRQETKADMAQVKADLLKWMFSALIAQGGLIVALVVALVKIL